ncbi:hypothetical protein [Pontibacter harenae]|uniref:hypothetical protein n=1 Tax=Pontibacter harenae TaxID=2894083 RepID=UPI001E640E38|nr:hypothetical protein [Pontibacter harenae]MCC9168278.1 hypothetical protein [Pontibacter harenae]
MKFLLKIFLFIALIVTGKLAKENDVKTAEAMPLKAPAVPDYNYNHKADALRGLDELEEVNNQTITLID